jgi:hypothetical protein
MSDAVLLDNKDVIGDANNVAVLWTDADSLVKDIVFAHRAVVRSDSICASQTDLRTAVKQSVRLQQSREIEQPVCVMNTGTKKGVVASSQGRDVPRWSLRETLAELEQMVRALVVDRRHEPVTARRHRPRRGPVSALVALRLRRLERAVRSGDIGAEEAANLRHGYEQARERERAGSPPLDLTY